MSALTLSKTRLREGVWEGILEGLPDAATAPELEVTHQSEPLVDVTVAPDGPGSDRWRVRIGIPAAILSDGVQTILIRDKGSGETLGNITLLAGEALEDDIRAEMDLLRGELDMLKRAFRRHCVETMEDL